VPTVPHLIGLLFAALAIIFLLFTLPRRSPQHPATARKANLRIGLIFAAASLFLLLSHRLPW
jgi:hypothetical protein